MMRLYHFPQSCSIAAHIVLEETGADYEIYQVDINKDEHRTPEYLSINPKGKIPALAVDGVVITENPAIQYYLAKRFPGKNLFPRGEVDQAEWISMLSWISNTLHVYGAHVTKTFHFADDKSVFPELQRKGLAEWVNCLVTMENRLEDRDWLVGNQYTTADAYLTLYLGGLRMAGASLADFPNLMAWLDRVIARPAVKAVLQRNKSGLLEMPSLYAAAAA